MTPELSIIMSVYNSEDTIQAAVRSILDQTFTDFEFIIVDDGCSDQTIPLINELTDPRIKLITNDVNIGLTRSLNKAIAASAGRYIARQDADDVSLPGRLEKQVEFLNTHPDVTLLGTTRGTLDETGKMISTITLLENPCHDDFIKRNCLVHGSIVIRREALIEAGGYNELFRFSQDYELWLRISKTHKVMNLQEPLYGVRRHGNRVTLTKMTQAGLFRMLALNLARGKVSDEVLEEVRQNGIEAYYDHLNDEDKLKYHRSAKNRSVKYKSYDEARYHLKKIAELVPSSLISRLELAKLSFMTRQRGQ